MDVKIDSIEPNTGILLRIRNNSVVASLIVHFAIKLGVQLWSVWLLSPYAITVPGTGIIGSTCIVQYVYERARVLTSALTAGSQRVGCAEHGARRRKSAMVARLLSVGFQHAAVPPAVLWRNPARCACV